MRKKLSEWEIGIGEYKVSFSKIYSHPLFSGSFLMVVGSLLINALNYVYHLAMGQLMGPEEYGGLKSVFSLIYLISIIPTSTSFAIVKYVSSATNNMQKHEIYQAVNKLVFRIALGMSVVVFALSPFLSRFLHLGEQISVMMISPILFFTLMALVNKATLQGMLVFKGVVIPEFVINFTKLILGIFLVYVGFNLPGATFAILVGAVFSYLASLYFIKGFVEKPVKQKNYDLKPILKYSFPVLLQSIAFTSLISTDILIVKHFLPAYEAGLYSALSTLGLIIYFAAQPVTGVMFPMISGKRSRGENYRLVFYLSALMTGFVSFGVVGIYYLFPELILKYSVGSQYVEASSSLALMGLFISFYTLAYFLVNFLLSLNKTKIVALPILMAGIQIGALWKYHNSTRQILSINVSVVVALLVGLLVYLGYNEVNRSYGKK